MMVMGSLGRALDWTPEGEDERNPVAVDRSRKKQFATTR